MDCQVLVFVAETYEQFVDSEYETKTESSVLGMQHIVYRNMALTQRLPCRPRVHAVVSDFKVAVWTAGGKVLPGVQHHGYAFHFAPSTWRRRRVQIIGLQSAYTKV